MILHAPSKTIFALSLVPAAVAVIGAWWTLPFVSSHAVWFAVAAYVVLAAGNLLRTA